MSVSKKVQRGFAVHPDWAVALGNVRIVLVGISHPGNIGSVARVMKNMGLRNLVLVSSTECGPKTDADFMASGAYDVVEQARRTSDLAEGLSQCLMAVGTSARLGRKRSSARTPEDTIPELMERARVGPVACVFGREARGLTNEEIKLCTHHMVVPTDADFASMNIAHACAITAYEIFKRACRPRGVQMRAFQPASVEEREAMFQHVQTVLTRAGFLEKTGPLRMMRDIRRILNSAQMDNRDAKIIRGIFRKMGNMVRIADEKVCKLEKLLGEKQFGGS
ncbi:MAG: RNA methyltransferase [Thermodesulfobacteriota bacterium]